MVGAGVVGSAIARELTLRGASCALIDAAADVGSGTSKANTAIHHTGFDAKPGTVEAELVAAGHALLEDYAARVGIPLARTGALMVAWNDEQLAALAGIEANAVANGCRDGRSIGAREVYEREPALGPGARGGFEIPGEGILCPFTTTLALATDAVLGGCELVLGARVTGIERGERFRLQTARGPISASYLVNAAGLRSDELDAEAGHGEFTVTPRRGELIVFDKFARGLVNRIVLPVPTAKTKGVLVSPTIYGNVLLGPTADDVPGKEDRSTTAAGLASLLRDGERIVPSLLEHEVTATYVGLRAATEDRDYQLRFHPAERYVCAGGIRSTGVSASMAIAERVRDGLAEAGLRLAPEPREVELQMPNIGEPAPRPYQRDDLIASDPDYGRIVCFCERVTRAELRAAARSPIPPADLDGLRRRSRALMGRCQGFFCAAQVAAGLAEDGGPGRAAGDRSCWVAPMAEDAVIVGGGPSGLAAAIELRRLGLAVTVIEREREPGGIPRHCDHSGFGIRDLRRVLSGPAYARRYGELAEEAGVEVRGATMVTGSQGGRRLELTGPAGRRELEPEAVVLATGCRERPRSARLVPGSRPAGVMTTSTLQQLVHLQGHHVGRRAVVVGAEHVSFSAIATLAHGGASVAALVTELPRHQSLAAFRIGAAIRYRAPLRCRTAVTAIRGSTRVEEVELTHLGSGATTTVDCDLVIFTADWIPDNELAVMAGCELDRGTLGPRVDPGLRTSVPGVFAAGNLVHPAETADVAALDGRHVAASVAAHLRAGAAGWPTQMPLEVQPPLRWIAPNMVISGGQLPPRGRFLLRSGSFLRAPRVEVSQAGATLWRGRLRRLGPGRSSAIPADWTRRADPAAGPLVVGIAHRG